MLNERWSHSAAPVWNLLIYISSLYRYVGGYHIWVYIMQKGGNALGTVAAVLNKVTQTTKAEDAKAS